MRIGMAAPPAWLDLAVSTSCVQAESVGVRGTMQPHGDAADTHGVVRD